MNTVNVCSIIYPITKGLPLKFTIDTYHILISYCFYNCVELNSWICAKRKLCCFYRLVFVALLTVVPIAGQELSYRLYCCFQAVTRDLKTKWSLPLIILIPCLPIFSYPSYPPLSTPPGKAGAGTSKDLKSANVTFFVHFICFLRLTKTKPENDENWPHLQKACVNQSLINKKWEREKPINNFSTSCWNKRNVAYLWAEVDSGHFKFGQYFKRNVLTETLSGR